MDHLSVSRQDSSSSRINTEPADITTLKPSFVQTSLEAPVVDSGMLHSSTVPGCRCTILSWPQTHSFETDEINSFVIMVSRLFQE